MGKIYDSIDGRLRDFLLNQHVFFVATAPSSVGRARQRLAEGDHRHLRRPRASDRVAYLDYTGSGAETIAHLRDNGRITLMFCAFSGPPTIVRLHGRGTVVTPEDPRFGRLREEFQPHNPHGLRAIIEVEVARISDSCGYSVPLMDYRATGTCSTGGQRGNPRTTWWRTGRRRTPPASTACRR